MAQMYLDVTRLVDRAIQGLLPTGVDRVTLAYVRHYGREARAVLAEKGWHAVLSASRSRRLFAMLLAETERPSRRMLQWQVVAAVLEAPWTRKRPGVLLHTAHSGIEFDRYYDGLGRRGIKLVAMIHDLIPLTHPEYCRPGVLPAQSRRMKVAMTRAAGIIANSADTARSVEKMAPRLGCPVPVMATALLAGGTPVRYPGDRPLAQPYFVVLSTIEPRKNHWMLLHIWRSLVERFGAGAPTLVVIGRRGWECENVVDMLERCEALQGKVIEESDCTDERLHLYLQHAQALLFPSFVEGYGMPLVEALQLGVPVIASHLGVFHEIAGDIPEYLDPLDGLGWTRLILEYDQADSPVRAAQLRRLRGYQAPSWQQHFEVVDAFVDRLSAG